MAAGPSPPSPLSSSSRSTSPPRRRRVVVVRHAERADEAPLQRLGDARWPPSRAFLDPPLTRRGEHMARLAGAHFVRATGAAVDADDRRRYDFAAVYTSPLLRCVQTAAGIAREFGGLRIVTCAALAACAQRVRDRDAAGKKVDFAKGVEVEAVLAGLTLEREEGGVGEDALEGVGQGVEVREALGVSADGSEVGRGDVFVEAVERLARKEDDGRALLVVTHREGLRELDKIAGEGRMLTPYCCAHEYDFDTVTGEWTLVHESRIRVPKPGGFRGSLKHDYVFAYVEEGGEPNSHSRCPIM